MYQVMYVCWPSSQFSDVVVPLQASLVVYVCSYVGLRQTALVAFVRILRCCSPSSECSKDSDGVPPLVPHIFVKGENAKEGKKDSSGTKKVPYVVPVKEVKELTGLVHLS